MHLKRYRRQTVKEALRAVREDLGPDALVLSTRTVTALGVRGLLGAKEVEITAAAERFAMTEDRHALTSERPETRAGNEIAARLEAGGMDPALAREIAAAHPATPTAVTHEPATIVAGTPKRRYARGRLTTTNAPKRKWTVTAVETIASGHPVRSTTACRNIGGP